MEIDILVKVRVSDEVHADLIYKDILNIVKTRTPIYHVLEPRLINTTISNSCKYKLKYECDMCGIIKNRYLHDNRIVIICSKCGKPV